MPIPNPEPGLVISYAYLWRHEHHAGREEGQKDRPSVIVLAVEIPLPVKRHLGLDDDRSWIIVDEGNEFLWPGYDLRKLPHSDRYDYGFVPPRFFNQVLEAFAGWYRSDRRRLTPRE